MQRAMILVLAALPLAACNAMGSDTGTKAEPSGSGGSRTFAVADFTQVELRGSDDVKVAVGPAFAIRAEGPAKLLEQLEIRKDGATLKVGRKRDGNFSWGANDGKLTVFVTMPSIVGAAVAGSGDMSVDKVSGGDFDGSLAGSGDLVVGALQATTASFNIAGSGTITATGQVQALAASIAGSGNVSAKGLRAAKADVSIAGSGDVTADVTGPAEVNLMGSGSANLGAGATCTVSKMGSGEATCGGK